MRSLKFLKKEFDNNLDKEKLIKNFSENIEIIDEQLFSDIRDEKIESKKFSEIIETRNIPAFENLIEH